MRIVRAVEPTQTKRHRTQVWVKAHSNRRALRTHPPFRLKSVGSNSAVKQGGYRVIRTRTQPSASPNRRTKHRPDFQAPAAQRH